MGNIKLCKCLRVITWRVKDTFNWLSIIFTGRLFLLMMLNIWVFLTVSYDENLHCLV